MTNASEWTVLLVDDEADIRDVISMELTDVGYQVVTAGDGEEGLRVFETMRPRIVITDIRMPKMDGLTVLARIKERDADTQVIVVTAYGEIDVAIRALQLDASDFITKPVHPDALHTALNRARDRYTRIKSLADYTRLLAGENARTAAELSRSIAFQKNLIEYSMDGIVGCDEAENIVTYNNSMEEILENSRGEVIGKMKLADLFARGAYAGFKEALGGDAYGPPDQLMLYETMLLSGEGNAMPVQVSATRISGAGDEDGIVCFFRDLRKIRKLEQQMADQARILHQDKMMSLGRLAASVVHEINNPLSGVLNYLKLMTRILSRGPLAADRQEKFEQYLDLVTRETERCSRIVSNLLTFSRKQKPESGPVDLHALIDRCLALSRHKLELGQIALEVNIAETLPQLYADDGQLHQCLINLILNAVDAMPGGGRLFVSARHDRDARCVEIVVRDTGSGIRPEDKAHLFDPFFTTKESGYGVGLGLSTVYGIIARHDGTIHVESEPGQGAAFILRLPVRQSSDTTVIQPDQ